MEKLPQRNLLLPNAPITPFSTSKKSKHAFKQMLSTSGWLKNYLFLFGFFCRFFQYDFVFFFLLFFYFYFKKKTKIKKNRETV